MAAPALADGDCPAVATVWDPADPIDLGLVLGQLGRGAGDPTLQWDRAGRHGPAGVWRTLRTPQGAATLHLAQSASGAVHARAWGPGAEWTIEGVPEQLGAGDDASGLDLSAAPALAEAYRRLPGLRLARVALVVEMLLAAILEQKVTVKEAHASWRWLLRRHGDIPPGPAPEGMRVLPSARRVLDVTDWQWHRCGLDGARRRALRAVASVASRLEPEVAGDSPALQKRLCSVPGIGVWTAAEVVQRALGCPDTVSVGDYHLKNIVGWSLAGRRESDDDQMLELLEPWRGQRQRVVRLLLAGSSRRPRRGPRFAPTDHRRI